MKKRFVNLPDNINLEFKKLHSLQDGWLDGEGKAPDRKGLEWFETMMEDYYPEDLPLPYIYPTGEGNLLLEWDIGKLDVSLEIGINKREGELHILDLFTGKIVIEKSFILDKNGWKNLVRILLDIFKHYNSSLQLHYIDENKFSVTKLKYVFDIKSGATPKSNQNELWDGNIPWITPEDLGKLRGHYIKNTKRSLTLKGLESISAPYVSKRSIVLSKRAPIGECAILAIDAMCNQGCFLLSKKNDKLDERFYYYYFFYIRKWLEALGRGSTFMELSSDDFRSLHIPLPRFSMQQKIADYLDKETARIDGLIESKEQMLKLLEEKRRAIVNRAVTRGLNPEAPTKPSGLDWLGEIPEYWETIKLKYIIKSLDQGYSPPASSSPALNDEYAILKISAISKGILLKNENKSIINHDDIDKNLSLKKHDILISRGNTPELVADACYISLNHPKILIPDLIYRLRVDMEKINPKFLVIFLISNISRAQIRKSAKGSNESMIKISQNELLNWYIPKPPLFEQKQIVAYIEQFIHKHKILTQELEKSIALLKERRSALIAAAVTGEINVEGSG